MCTVTYLPWAQTGFLLTANRDEQISRPRAQAPRRHCLHGQTLVFPRDPQGGGTWVATAGNGYTVCLLNGAFTKHNSQPPYRRSRGLVLLDFFQYAYAGAFATGYHFEGIEPFTLLAIITQPERTLTEIRWDGTQVHMRPKDSTKPHIWSSATLYSPAVQARREQWFAQWLAGRAHYALPDILNFHRTTGQDEPANALCMTRDDCLQTVSITAVTHHEQEGRTLLYEDRLEKSLQPYRIL